MVVVVVQSLLWLGVGVGILGARFIGGFGGVLDNL